MGSRDEVRSGVLKPDMMESANHSYKIIIIIIQRDRSYILCTFYKLVLIEFVLNEKCVSRQSFPSCNINSWQTDHVAC